MLLTEATWLSFAAEALKIFAQGSRNIMELKTQGLKGWVDGTDPCQGWTGITCNDDDRVIAMCVLLATHIYMCVLGYIYTVLM